MVQAEVTEYSGESPFLNVRRLHSNIKNRFVFIFRLFPNC